MNRVNTIIAQGENSPRDYANLGELPQTAYQASKQTPYTTSKASTNQSKNDSPMDIDEFKKHPTLKTVSLAQSFRKRMSIDPSKGKNLKLGHLESAPGLINSPGLTLNLDLFTNDKLEGHMTNKKMTGTPPTSSDIDMLPPLDSGKTPYTQTIIQEEDRETPVSFRRRETASIRVSK